jgi:hypothetical protein
VVRSSAVVRFFFLSTEVCVPEMGLSCPVGTGDKAAGGMQLTIQLGLVRG